MSSVYQINKGINKPVEFRGLKAQYIWYLAGGLLSLLIIYAALYLLKVNTYVCLVIVGGLGGLLFMTVYRMNHKYGEHGIMKKRASRAVPHVVKSYSRKVFIQLVKQD